MEKFRRIAFVSLILAFLLTGCGNDKIVADDPLSEDEIISYVQEKIHSETGEDVDVEIVSKKQLEVATMWLDGPMNYKKVDGGHEYELEITSKKDKNVVAKGTYKDGYIVYSNKDHPDGVKKEPVFYSDFKSRKGVTGVKNEFIKALDERFDEYYIFDDVSTSRGLDVFICSSDYDQINGLLKSFKNTVIRFKSQEYVTYSVYIYKDAKAFKNTDFEKFKTGSEPFGGQSNGRDMIGHLTGKQPVKLSYCKSFDKQYFESNGVTNAKKTIDESDPGSFDYVVFWYDAEPNSFAGSNSPKLYVFGVK